jgi:hypothetical protein
MSVSLMTVTGFAEHVLEGISDQHEIFLLVEMPRRTFSEDASP